MKRLIIVTLLSLLLASSLGIRHTSALFEGAKDQACQGINLTNNPSGNGCDSGASTNNILVGSVLRNALIGFSVVVGVIAVIMIIIGGVKYITSSGESSNVNSAKNTILYAIIGLVVVLLAQVIIHFVINRVSSSVPCPDPAQKRQADGTCA